MAAIVMLNKTTLIGRHATTQVPKIVGCFGYQKRESSELTDVRRGRGGRSSFSGTVATVFGASGFLGRIVVSKLGKTGSQVIIPYRLNIYDVDPLKVCGDLGQILFSPFHLEDEDSLRKAMKYSNVVINLIGREWETRNFSFDKVHNEGARRIARLAKESGIKKLIHFSSLNASPNPQQIYIKGGSKFLKSKYDGELAVREEFPEAIIFRPADMFGCEDKFTKVYASIWRRAHGTIPLWKKGDATIKQPVFVGDCAEGILQAIRNPDAYGQTYELVGPHRYYLADLVDFIYQVLRYKGFSRSYLTPLFKLKIKIMGMAPSKQIYNMEKIERDHVTDIVTGCLTLEDLGVQLTRIEERIMYDLKPYRQNSYYADVLGEFKDPQKPLIVT